MAIADYPYSFASQPIIDPTTGQPVLNATGGVLLDPKTGNSLPIADMNGNAILSISGNAYGQSQQFRSTQLAVLVQFGSVYVQAPSIEMFDLVQTTSDAVSLATAAQTSAASSASSAAASAAAAALSGSSAVSSVAGRTGAVVVSKLDVGLGNVDNTADANKPVSGPQSTALASKANDSAVPHLAGPNVFTGVNTFTSSPVVPTPVNPTDAANRAYVLANAGTGGAAVDDSATLTTGTASTTAPWSASNAKGQTLALLAPGGPGVEQAQDIIGAMVAAAGGTYNDAGGTITLPSASAGGSSAPLDASAAPYNVSTAGTRAANSAGLLAAVQAAGKRPVTLPPGRYKMNVSFTDEDINIDAPGATFVQPSVAGDTKPIMTVERTLGAPFAVGPTRVVEWGPRIPGGVSSSARYTAIDLISGNYQNWARGDLCHISSKDAYPWTWTALKYDIATQTDGLAWQAAYVPLLGIGLLVINTTNGGPREQMVVQGSISGTTGLIASDLPGNGNGGITATQAHIVFAEVSGDFVSGDVLTRIAGGNPDGGAGTFASVGQAVGTVSGSPMLLANRVLDDAYGAVTAANIAAGAPTYGPGTQQPNQTDTSVRLRKINRNTICVVRANFDIDAAPGTQDDYLTFDYRADMVKFRGVFGAQFDCRIFNSWTRAVVVTSCYGGRWRGYFDGLPNHAYLDQNGFGYGFECKSASEANVFELWGRNLRHAFTTNPDGRTFSTTNNNAVLDYGTPKFNTVQNSVVHASYTNSYDTHAGDYYTRFINCTAIGGGSGGAYASDGGAQFSTRGFGTQFINCRSENSVEGISILGPEHDPGFDHTYLVKDCTVTGFQSRGLFITDAITARASIIIDGGRYIGDGSATNRPYQHEGFAIGGGVKAIIKGETEVGGFNGFPLRMRAGSGLLASELDIISMFIDRRGTTTGNAQNIRVDATLARATLDGITLRLKDTDALGGLITNRGGTTAFGIGRIVQLGSATIPTFQTTAAGGTPTSFFLTDFGGGGGGTGGSVDWANIVNEPTTFPPTSHTHPAGQISDSTAVGRAVLLAADQQAARAAIGAGTGSGTSNLTLGTTATTAAPGNHTHVASSVGFTPNGSITATDVQAAIVQAASTGGGSGSAAIYVWRYTAGAWPTLPTTRPTGVMKVEAIGPAYPATATIPAWVGLAAAQTPMSYSKVAVA